MSSASGRLAVPIPKLMRTLERDPRGYPIPFIVLRTGAAAHFPVNDVRRVGLCYRKSLCGICGKRLERRVWFVGGPLCFGSPRGAFIDPPMHHDCAEYALRVCPFLAAPSYARRIEDAKVRPGELARDMKIVKDERVVDARPTIFGFGETGDYRLESTSPVSGAFVVESWEYVEYWRFGAPVNAPSTPTGGLT